MRFVLPSAICVAVWASVCGQAQALEAKLDSKLRGFLKEQFAKDDSPGFETYAAVARANLTNNGLPMVVVYLTGNEWCGSAGCTLAVVQPIGGTFKVLSRTPIVQLPVKVLTSRAHGWSDLAVGVGGGRAKSRLVKLSFNGKGYAGNPSTSPHVSAKLGTVLIAENERGEALSP
jgi:hypothetical protein